MIALNTFGLRTLQRCCIAFFLATVAEIGVAGVVMGGYTLGGTRQGLPGQDVSFAVEESNLNGFEGAQLRFTFDSTVLTLLTDVVSPTSYGTQFTVGISDVAGLATYSLFLTADSGPVSGPVELFDLFFHINAGAPVGPTTLNFTNDALGSSDVGIYDRPSLTGTISVVSAAALPSAGTLPLVLTALILLALIRRSPRTAAPQASVRSA